MVQFRKSPPTCTTSIQGEHPYSTVTRILLDTECYQGLFIDALRKFSSAPYTMHGQDKNARKIMVEKCLAGKLLTIL
jgi:hypothetical protein